MNVLIDPQLSDRFRGVCEPLELRDGSGQTYGYFHPAVVPQSPDRRCPKSPLTEKELARRLATPGGRPLAEIWNDLGAK